MRWILGGGLGLLWVAGCGDPVGDRPAKWSYISAAIIEPSCSTASCHSKLGRAKGLELESKDGAYTMLVGGGFVVPGAPDQSKLMFLLRGKEVNRRMPPDVPLSDPDIALVERWILEGAKSE